MSSELDILKMQKSEVEQQKNLEIEELKAKLCSVDKSPETTGTHMFLL